MKHLLNKIESLKERSFFGGMILIISMIFMSIGNGFVHHLSNKYDAISILFYKSFFSLFVLMIVCPSFSALKQSLYSSSLKYNLLRAIAGTCGSFLWIPSVQFLNLQDVSALSLTSSLFSAVGGYFFLKEGKTFGKILCLIFGFLGAYIILNPHFETKNWLYLLPIGSAFCFGMSAVLARYLTLKNQEYTTSLYLFLTMLFISLPFGFVLPQTAYDGLILSIIGLLYGASQILYVKSYKYAQASYLANYKFLKVPFHALWGTLFFCEIPTLSALIGTLFIILAIFLTSNTYFRQIVQVFFNTIKKSFKN
ncbi:MAG: DMT family transporter [Proteobacteria bacterium]|nr:DMT family transporter [Pseudomonadota bacterium]